MMRGEIFLHTFCEKVWPSGSGSLSFGENSFSTAVAALCNTSADHHMGRGLRKMDRGGGGHARAASTHERRACAHTHPAQTI